MYIALYFAVHFHLQHCEIRATDLQPGLLVPGVGASTRMVFSLIIHSVCSCLSALPFISGTRNFQNGKWMFGLTLLMTFRTLPIAQKWELIKKSTVVDRPEAKKKTSRDRIFANSSTRKPMKCG